MITPIPDQNRDDEMSVFSNILLLCQNTMGYSDFSNSTDVLGLEYVELDPYDHGDWVL